MPTPLELAIAVAAAAHQGQKDKTGEPYILHPLRIMLSLTSETERVVAMLHDVVEDTAVTLGDLRRHGFSEEVIAAVDCLTHRPEESYEEYVVRAGGNPLARRVKLADLADNMELRRLPVNPLPKDWERMARYRRAWDYPQATDRGP
ncbi:MAG: HD domain-containing protein [Magnetococcales bacterium]|nr:HD domain-containing protein [Magnetococcales bacterium]